MKKRSRRRKNEHMANRQLECQPKRNHSSLFFVLLAGAFIAFITYGISLAIKSDEKKAAERTKALLTGIQSGDCEQFYQQSLEAAANQWWQTSAAKGVLYQNCRDRHRQK